MTTIRTFIAIELSDEAKNALTRLQNRLKALVPPHSVRWAAPQNIHLTLHFLGDVNARDVDKISGALQFATGDSRPFSLKLEGLGCFPNTRRPRVLWVGLPEKSDPLVNLHCKLGDQLKKTVGFSPETRPYSPHLTLGRVKKGIPSRNFKQLSQVIKREQPTIGILAQLRVLEICLIKSELKPGGAVYTQISRGELISN